MNKCKRSQRLTSVIKLALHDELEAAKKLELALSRVDKQEQHLVELLQYQKEYLQRHAKFAQQEKTIGKLRSYRGFLDNLVLGISRQKEIIVQAQNNYATLRAEWLERRNRRRSLAKVSEQHERDEDTDRQRAVQRTQDERSGRQRPQGNKGRS